MLRLDVSETNTCDIATLCAVSQQLALAPNWNGNRLLNHRTIEWSGVEGIS